MEDSAIQRKSISDGPLDFKLPQNQYRAVRSATTLVSRPATFNKGIGMIVQLIFHKEIAPRAKQLLYAAIETASGMIMSGKNSGKMEVEEPVWREMIDIATKNGGFSERQFESNAEWTAGAPTRLRVAESVLQSRTNRFSIVLESPYDDFNQQAVIRTADCFGIQTVHVVTGKETKQSTHKLSESITKKTMQFMTLHHHQTTKDCIEALRKEGREIWATDLSPGAIPLDSQDLQIPEKLAVVFGRELDGCSQEILEAADRRVFIPIYGFAESLNLSVAASLVMQQLFFKCPEARGNLTTAEKATLRERWYDVLGRQSKEKQELFRSFLAKPPPPLEDLRRAEKISYATPAVRERLKRKQSQMEESSSDSIEQSAQKKAKLSEDPGL